MLSVSTDTRIVIVVARFAMGHLVNSISPFTLLCSPEQWNQCRMQEVQEIHDEDLAEAYGRRARRSCARLCQKSVERFSESYCFQQENDSERRSTLVF